MGAVRTDSDMCCMAPGPIQFVLPHPMMGLHAPRPEKLKLKLKLKASCRLS